MDLNAQAYEGSGTYEVYELGQPKANESVMVENYIRQPNAQSLDQIFHQADLIKKVQSGPLAFSKNKSGKINIKNLPEAIYKVKVITKDRNGNEVTAESVVLIAGNLKKISTYKLPPITLFQEKKYYKGDQLRVLMGAFEDRGPKYLKFSQSQYVFDQKVLPESNGFHLYQTQVTEKMVRGITLTWFSAYDYKAFQASESVEVPAREKELKLDLDLAQVLKPGQKEKIKVRIAGKNSRQNYASLIKVYDRSLEYYNSESKNLLNSLYYDRRSYLNSTNSFLSFYSVGLPVSQNPIESMMKKFFRKNENKKNPSLYMLSTREYGEDDSMGGYRGVALKGVRRESLNEASMDIASANGGAAEMAMVPTAGAAASSRQAPPSEKQENISADAGNIQMRSDMSETALYESKIHTSSESTFNFKAPDRLTSWKVQAEVLSQDGKVGSISREIQTKKELMVRIEMPRFFREGDRSSIKAIVHNETDRPISGQIEIRITQGSESHLKTFSLKDSNMKKVELAPKSQTNFSWDIVAPSLLQEFNIQVVGRAGNLNDAEEKKISVLPSRQRLLETQMVALKGNSRKEIKLSKWDDKDKTRQNELLQLQIDPQLALAILQSIPYLVEYPYNCTDQLVHRYVPLALMNSLFNKYPKLKEALKKVPERSTILPPWEQKDSRRLIELVETPWVENAEGEKSIWPLLNLLNAQVVSRMKESVFIDLLQRQTNSGAFAWLPGGKDDLYITLNVLEGFAQAQRYGVDYPQAAVRKALQYSINEIAKHLQPNSDSLAFVLYASYVITSFNKDLSDSVRGYEAVKTWMKFVDSKTDMIMPLGRAMAALVYNRLGDKAKSEAYLKRAMDGAREDEMVGMYWAPESRSWLWTNDTIEKHAFIIKTLTEIKPKDSRLPALVQWLLFNRKGNEWKSTKATAAAVYSLIDYMKAAGALEKKEIFDVNWADMKSKIEIDPLDFMIEPLRWTKTGNEIKESHGKVKITKSGPGVSFASLTWIYTTDKEVTESTNDLISLKRKLFLRKKIKDDYQLIPLGPKDSVKVGDEVVVELTIKTKSQFEYMHLKDPRGSGFESQTLLSGWQWDYLSRYEEVRDSMQNFFINWLPHGEYILKHTIRPTTAGECKIGAAVLQSMYSPDLSAHSSSISIKVVE